MAHPDYRTWLTLFDHTQEARHKEVFQAAIFPNLAVYCTGDDLGMFMTGNEAWMRELGTPNSNFETIFSALRTDPNGTTLKLCDFIKILAATIITVACQRRMTNFVAQYEERVLQNQYRGELNDEEVEETIWAFKQALEELRHDPTWLEYSRQIRAFALRAGCPVVLEDPLDSIEALQKLPVANRVYTIAIICALGFEMSAIRYMLDREHPRLPMNEGDPNIYVLGELSGHHVVLATFPGNQGKGAAATVATNVNRTFPTIRWRFLVGIGGGVPSDNHDIRLGDVVISMPDGPYGGVVQYDLGKDTEDDFQLRGFLWPPPSGLRHAVQVMQSDHLTAENKVAEFLNQMLRRSPGLSSYARPLIASDILFSPDYLHLHGESNCDRCDQTHSVARVSRVSEAPEIHYGLIASGDRVVKSATKRNLAAQAVGDILCFEMEAAGIATEFSCVVIRGISDYADTHKNDSWQHYAAATAAALTKELLSYLIIS